LAAAAIARRPAADILRFWALAAFADAALPPFFARIAAQRALTASAIALLFIAGMVLTRPTGPSRRAPAAELETALADSGAFTYRDYSAGTTLVWFSYPADTEMAANDEMDTIE